VKKEEKGMKHRVLLFIAGMICTVLSAILFLTNHETLGQFFLVLAGLFLIIIAIMVIVFHGDWEEERKEEIKEELEAEKQKEDKA
jgi:glucose uptake protein GlcU